jgi:hypothetical protein
VFLTPVPTFSETALAWASRVALSSPAWVLRVSEISIAFYHSVAVASLALDYIVSETAFACESRVALRLATFLLEGFLDLDNVLLEL